MKKGIIIGILTLFVGQFMQAQDTLQTERLIIIKPYSPTVSDAVKVKQVPVVDDSLTASKKKLTYDVVSVPVASTFVPEKGKAAKVETAPGEKLYDSYARLGFGNYTRILGEFYTGFQLSEAKTLNFSFLHHSSQGGAEDALLDDKFYNTNLGVGFLANDTYYSWGLNLEAMHKLVNWYGVPKALLTPSMATLEPQQMYYGLSLGGNITYYEGLFDQVKLKFRHFGDDYGSGENYLYLSPEFGLPIGEHIVFLDLYGEYLSGNFDQNYSGGSAIDYGHLSLGTHPGVSIHTDNFNMHLGAEFVYAKDMENESNDFFIYPKVKASYRIANGYFIPYAGVDGGLKQNTYHDFAQENPFVSPTLFIAPTSTLYNAFLGVKGKFTETVDYNFKMSYRADENAAFFVSNPSGMSPSQMDYQHENAFSVVYDDLNTLAFHGELGVNVSEDFRLRLAVAYFSYDVQNEKEAWNKPQLEASANMNYQITEKWSVGADLFYVGERQEKHVVIGDFPPYKTVSSLDLDSYFDLNFNVEYQINTQFSVYAKGDNLLGNNYQRWYGYPVLGTQALLGVSYKFDW